MATFNKEDLIKWNDLSTSLQDIIMRKITWDMLHPDLQAWLLDKEKRIIELERWRRTKADPMLDDHENRIGSCESEISRIWSKLGSAEGQISNIGNNSSGGGELFDVTFHHDYNDPNGIYRWNIQITGRMTASGFVEITNSIRFDFYYIRTGQYILIPMGPFTQDLSRPADHYSVNAPVKEGDFQWAGYIHPTMPRFNPLGLTSPTINHYIICMLKYNGPTGYNTLAFTNSSGRIAITGYDPINKKYPQDFKITDLDDGTVQWSESLFMPTFRFV